MFSKAKKVGKARRNLGMQKNLRNTIRISEHWNINAWNKKKQRKKNAGMGDVKRKLRNAGTRDTKGF